MNKLVCLACLLVAASNCSRFEFFPEGGGGPLPLAPGDVVTVDDDVTVDPDVSVDLDADVSDDVPADDPVATDRDCPGAQRRCNGQCVNLARDPDHCGACGRRCAALQPHAVSACVASDCALRACSPSWGNCNADMSDGCETPLDTVDDCGACGAPCRFANAAATCAAGACAMGACVDGYGDCDGDPSNGCETRLSTSTRHCGRCGVACPAPAGRVALCAAGVCGSAPPCDDPTRGNCDGTGCSTQIDRDVTNCGGCGVRCSFANAAATCDAGRCAMGPCAAGYEDCDHDPANGCEASLTTTTRCGRCDNSCALAGASAHLCAAGVCQVSTCAPGRANCDGTHANGCEVDTQSDARNCGGCGNACPAGQSCRAGACVCPTGQTDCAGACVNTATDGANCGRCGAACPAGQSCAAGACACPAGQSACGGACVNPQTDVANCGACGTACPTGASCAAGRCACPSGRAACGGACVDTSSDGANCGACGRACPAGQTCAGGACRAQCADTVCGSSCVDTRSNTSHCGGCDRACSAVHGAPSCAAGACSIACAAGYGDCDGMSATGCETDTRASLAHCGACGRACAPPHATGACAAGACAVARCDAGWGDCDGNAMNGCETSLTTLAACGACGVACSRPHAAASCAAGTCTLGVCDGWGNCDGNDANGCETATATAVNHCGACGRACSLPHATPTCAAGMCVVSSCDAGWADCDRNPTNGCEASLDAVTSCGACGVACGAGMVCDARVCAPNCLAPTTRCGAQCATLATDVSHCGMCGRACPTAAHASPTCASGSCSIACDAGYGNCDAMASTGCETDTRSTLAHCGACGRACAPAHATGACSAATCTVARCDAGWGDCDGNAANGCETSLTTLAACGACGTTCARAHATATCATGACALGACDAGWGNCDGNDANGCETALTSLTHCGMCNRACASPNAQASCATGACVMGACNAGWSDCNASAGDGCEAHTDVDVSRCGACGTVCTAPTGSTPTCSAGRCGMTALSCTAPVLDCDMLPGNGCETDTRSTLAHCGACGQVCGGANASPSCASGACALSCNPGYASCDGNNANGCETSTATSTAHCGGCGRACPVGASCDVGACRCPSGYLDCGGFCRNVVGDVNNCGACGAVCALAHTVTAGCAAGRCTALVCQSGWGNCDGSDANGCETDLTAVTSCGACGRACSGVGGSASCVAGACRIACAPGRADCNADASDGCEVDLTANALHCGACGAACASGVTCAGSRCGTVTQLTAGPSHACLVTSTGALACWGDNRAQQLGVSSPTSVTRPQAVPGVGGVLELAAGERHVFARASGTAHRAWGMNDFGQIAGQVVTPMAPAGTPYAPTSSAAFRMTRVASGWTHACAITDTGAVMCWGRNQRSQLGNGTTTTTAQGAVSAATTVTGLSGHTVVQLALGRFHTCARTSAGRVLCWGDNTYGQLGRTHAIMVPNAPATVVDGAGADLLNVDEIAAGDGFTCARRQGNVLCWGDNLNLATGSPLVLREVEVPTAVPGVTTAVQIAAGAQFACARLADGRVQCWGQNNESQCGTPSSTARVTASSITTVRRGDGSVLTGVEDLALGQYHGCARTHAGEVGCWGRGLEGQLGDGTTISRAWFDRAVWP